MVLPIIFTGMHATKIEKKVLVDWAVANEIGLKNYEIERSGDGVNFSKIGEVVSRNSSIRFSNEFSDTDPQTGVNYYRIRSVQLDGQFVISEIANVKFGASVPGIKVISTAVINNHINVEFVSIEKGGYKLWLYNCQGVLVFKNDISHPGGSGHYMMPIPGNLHSGIYMIRVGSFTQQVVL